MAGPPARQRDATADVQLPRAERRPRGVWGGGLEIGVGLGLCLLGQGRGNDGNTA
jgi:hypothetical protein